MIKPDNRAYFKALGAHIAVLRNQHKMTQAELARAIGTSQQSVFAYELGDRRIQLPHATRLARVFSMSVDELIGTQRPRPKRRRLSPRVVRHAEKIQQLPKTEQRVVIRIIDALMDRYAASTLESDVVALDASSENRGESALDLQLARDG